ncbi:Parallel beta-helix repeat [Paracoccaceae bacterium]
MNAPQIVPSDAAQAVLPAVPESQLAARPDPLLSLFERIARRAPTGMTLSIASLGLAACGGNGDGGGGGQTDQIGGVALKGLLEGAFAFADYDRDGVWDQGTEPGQLTDANGEFQLDVTVEGAQIVVTTDANTIDGSTGLATPGITLKAPSGSTVISPLTTLVVETGLTPAQIAANLGLPEGVDLLTFNPFALAPGADQALAEAALEVEKSSHMVMGTIRAIAAALKSGGIDASEAYRLAAAAVTDAVRTATPDAPLDFTNADTIRDIFTAAASEAVGLPDDFVNLYSDAITNAIVAANSAVQSATSLEDSSAFSGPSNLVNAINGSDLEDLDDALSGFVFSKVELGNVVSFSGNATGPITVSLEDNTATFYRGGVSVKVENVANKTIRLADGQTLSVDLATYQALGPTDGAVNIADDGVGTVEITGIDGKTYEIAANVKFWVLPNGMNDDEAQDFFSELDVGDVVYMPSGRHDFDVTLNVDNVTLLGANFGEAVHRLSEDESFVEFYDDIVLADSSGANITEETHRADIAQEIRDDLVKFDTSASPRDLDESWISGKITIAASGVTLDGLRLHNAEGGLGFATGVPNINDFALLNSYLTGHAAGSIRFADADYVLDQESGAMTGDASSGWRIEGNLIGGVSTSSSNGGSLYLTGLADSSISGNVFWRPGAAHLYLEDLTSVTLENNFFYHGMHAGGANFDGLLGGVGSGYGYGYGYGTDTGYGYGYGGSGSGYGYGYGNDSGYGGSGSGYGYGYGNDGGYGYGYGYGGYGYGGNGGGGPFFGRNYWLELKGVNDGVTFSDNLGLFNSGGIQVWDEGSTLNNFSDITISGNTFALSINADPSGYLDSISGTSRHKSGIMGGVVWSTEDESASSGLIIDGNLIEGDIGQVMNDGDIRSLILIQGGVDGVEIEGNTLSWDWLTRDGSVPPGATAGIMLSRTLIDREFNPVDVSGNTFSHPGLEELPSGYSWAGVYLNVASLLEGEDRSEVLRFGLNNDFEGFFVGTLEDLVDDQDTFIELTEGRLYPYGYPLNAAPEQAYDDGRQALVFSF